MDVAAKEEATYKFCRMELILIVWQRLKCAVTHRYVCFDMFSPAGFMDGVVIAMTAENDTVPLDAVIGKSWTSDIGLLQPGAVMSSSRLVRAPREDLVSSTRKVTASSSTSLVLLIGSSLSLHVAH